MKCMHTYAKNYVTSENIHTHKTSLTFPKLRQAYTPLILFNKTALLQEILLYIHY